MSQQKKRPSHPVVEAPLSSRFWRPAAGARLVEEGGVSPGVTHPRGFLASGVTAGLKSSRRPDVGVVAVAPDFRERSSSAAVFTPSAFAAAPVVVSRSECELEHLWAVVMNSGNANACTGEQGLVAARAMQEACSEVLGISPQQVGVGSTGIIGVPLDAGLVAQGAKKAAAALTREGGANFARAIMTTDRFPKACALDVDTAQGCIRVGVATKGAGMISPAMATMLCVVTTDAWLSAEQARSLLGRAVSHTFNRVTVDGDMSTNDCAFLLCSGASGIRPTGQTEEQLALAVESALLRVALMMVADGEGSTKVIRLKVKGAESAGSAEKVARGVANSTLVKTAMHGCDPNWGRILGAAGAALAGGSYPSTALWLAGIQVVERASARALTAQERAQLLMAMHDPELEVVLDLGAGDGEAELFFADLGHEYVRINAEYHT